MTYKKVRDTQITQDDIQIDSTNLVEKQEVYLATKYTQEIQNFSVCINSYDYNTQTYICSLCSHDDCQKLLGFVEAQSEDNLKVLLNHKMAWILENEDNRPIKAGDYITTSSIKGIMRVTNSPTRNRVGMDCDEVDNVLLQRITGYDRMGLLHEPILNDDGNPCFERLPKVRYFNHDGGSSEEYKYIQDIKRCSVMNDIKSKRIDLNTVEKIKREDNDRISRLTRNTKSVNLASKQIHPLLQRRDSNTSFLTRRSSGTNLLSSRRSLKKEESKVEPIKRSIFKAYLLPIF